MVEQNTKQAKAEIEALTHHIPALLKSGRDSYWSVVRFADKPIDDGLLWHLYVQFSPDSDPDQKRFAVTVSIFSDGPEDMLYVGSEFVLLGDDGETIKARGTIVG
ncbi:MAG: hypothetical protein IH624_15710 [Phycisphaerae bacterium]|nr:hypothetical protein [Phycisphaerae bacterium]